MFIKKKISVLHARQFVVEYLHIPQQSLKLYDKYLKLVRYHYQEKQNHVKLKSTAVVILQHQRVTFNQVMAFCWLHDP